MQINNSNNNGNNDYINPHTILKTLQEAEEDKGGEWPKDLNRLTFRYRYICGKLMDLRENSSKETDVKLSGKSR